jgi:hypothetical protein
VPVWRAGRKSQASLQAFFENAESWRELFCRLRARQTEPPKLVFGDEKLGFGRVSTRFTID